jgi:hypothetical protein
MISKNKQIGWLLGGDVLTILVVTWIGFLRHYGTVESWRWLTTFLPVLIAWFAIAPWLGVYRMEYTCQFRDIWRPALAALLSAPLAATLRGAWLNSAVLPLFVGVLGLTNALGFILWRGVWAIVIRRFDNLTGSFDG